MPHDKDTYIFPTLFKVGWLVFYDISIFVSYLMLNPVFIFI